MHRYVAATGVAFSLGIAWRTFYDFGWACVVLSVVLSAFTFLFLHAQKKEYVLLLIVCVAFTCGLVRMEFAIPNFEPLPKEYEHMEFNGRVVREPDVRESSINLIVESDTFMYRVLVRAPLFTNVQYGDTIQVNGAFELPENFEGDTGRIFNYKGYLTKDGIQFIVSNPDVTVLHHNVSLTGSLLVAKAHYLRSLKTVLGEPNAALAGGITVGERRSLGEELTQNFRDVGLIHIIVLSGYNIAVIVIFIVAVLSFFPQRIRYSLAVVCIILFTLLVGASATVVRAAIMGCVGALGVMAGRTYDALHTLFLAGIMMLLWNPYLLVYDPSFQLSFVATFGLIIGSPLLMPHLAWVPKKFALREIFAATITTQIAVLPLLLYMIGAISVSALLVNMIVLPVIPLAMLLTFMTGMIALVSTQVALVVAFVASLVLSYVVSVVRFFASIPFSVFSVPEFSFSFVVSAYLVLLGLVWYIKRKGDSKQK